MEPFQRKHVQDVWEEKNVYVHFVWGKQLGEGRTYFYSDFWFVIVICHHIAALKER